MAAINELQAAANSITTDILGGRLGAGISNTDREFILAALGDVGNEQKTAGERYAGWTRAKNRMVQVGMLPKPNLAEPRSNKPKRRGLPRRVVRLNNRPSATGDLWHATSLSPLRTALSTSIATRRMTLRRMQ
jgi:hypothetical protein